MSEQITNKLIIKIIIILLLLHNSDIRIKSKVMFRSLYLIIHIVSMTSLHQVVGKQVV